MLVLSRRIGEGVVIGNGVVVTVLAVRGRQVRLGFEAPRDVAIWRQEKEWSEFPPQSNETTINDSVALVSDAT